MNRPSVALSAQAPGMAPGVDPFRIPLPCVGSLATLGPAKVVGLVNRMPVDSGLAHRLWGACGFRRSDRRDGDGKAPGISHPLISTYANKASLEERFNKHQHIMK